MGELKSLLKRSAELNTIYLVNEGITEQDIVDLCTGYHLTKKIEPKGSYYIIQFYKEDQLITDFKELFESDTILGKEDESNGM